MGIAKVGDPAFEGLISDTENDEDKIDHIGTPHVELRKEPKS